MSLFKFNTSADLNALITSNPSPIPSEYTVASDFDRMNVSSHWRISSANSQYQLCPTYSSCLVVPAAVSDTTLKHAAKFRSKRRIAALSYFHAFNGEDYVDTLQSAVDRAHIEPIYAGRIHATSDHKLSNLYITYSCTHHLFIFKHLILSISSSTHGTSTSTLSNIPSPKANALAQTGPSPSLLLIQALGAGTEHLTNYKSLKLIFLNIENIHAIRESLMRLHRSYTDACGNATIVTTHQVDKSGWQGHLRTILEGTGMIVRAMHEESKHVILHCSDGWDRTAQLCALSQLCLFSPYRTLPGFLILIKKEFLAFGHKFSDRHFTGSSANATESSERFSFKSPHKEIAPVFLQFLACVFSLMQERRGAFGFCEGVLEVLYEAVYDERIGTFRSNCEKEGRERNEGIEVWDLIDERFEVNEGVVEVGVIMPGKVAYWWAMYGNTQARRDSVPHGADEKKSMDRSIGNLKLGGDAFNISLQSLGSSFGPLDARSLE